MDETSKGKSEEKQAEHMAGPLRHDEEKPMNGTAEQ